MKKKLQKGLLALSLFLTHAVLFAQTPAALGRVAPFALFTSSGAVTNVGISQVTGNVGTNSSTSTGFGNVNGQMHDLDSASANAAFDLNLAYNSLGAQSATMFPGILLGGGTTLNPAVYSVPAVSTLSGTLTLDGLNNPNACFVFQLNAAFSASPGSKVVLVNGAKACNVFWRVNGAVGLATGVTFVGTIIANGAITFASGVDLEGRALSKVGAVGITGTKASAPIGCGSPYLTGPPAPNIGSTTCYALLTANGALTNTGITHIVGDVGTNNGPLVTGFNPLFVTGTIHLVPDGSTATGAADLLKLYDSLNAIPYDIELLYPAQFGRQQVLTPHVYIMKAAAQLTDTIFLDAQGNPDAVFVIQIDGAFTTSTYSNVTLRGGTKASNVFWLVKGLITISDYSNFNGTAVAATAISLLGGGKFSGRLLSKAGAITTADITMAITGSKPVITPDKSITFCKGDTVTLTSSLSTSYKWSNGDTTRSIRVDSSGSFYVITPGACGPKDTSATMVLTRNPSYLTNKTALLCNGDSILIGGVYRKTPGTYYDSLKTILACDSIFKTVVSAGAISTTNNPQKICPGKAYTINSHSYSTIGSYNDTLKAKSGCDSIIITVITISPTYSVNNPQTICTGGSYVINGHTYSGAGTYHDTIPTINSCDSIVHTVLTLNPAVSVNNPQTICNGKPYTINGHTYTIAANYNDTFKTTGGCDSIVKTALTVNPTYSTNNPRSICSGGSYTINGNTYTTAATYNDTLSTMKGCDSIIVTQLTVYPVYTINKTASICDGDSLLIAGAYRKIAGTYSDTLTTIQGCDSSTVTALTVYPVYTTNLSAVMCNGDSLFIAGSFRYLSGSYPQKFATIHGCDSTVVTTLTVNPSPLANTGPYMTILLGGPGADLGAASVTGNSYSWTPATGLSSTTISQPHANPVVTTTYFLTETNTNTGCSMTNSVVITVVTDLDFYNGFSPNGDDVNDYWRIPILDYYPDNKVTIINRWGNEVWVGVNYNNKDVAWTGVNMNGDKLPDGTYYYIINYNNTEKRGWVFIKR